jgi:hypothetical protein
MTDKKQRTEDTRLRPPSPDFGGQGGQRKVIVTLRTARLPLYAFFFSLSSFFFPGIAYALGIPYWGPLLPRNRTLCGLLELVQNVSYFGITLTVFVLAPLFILIGGFIILTAGGSEPRFGRGKQTLTAAVVGLVIALGSYLILSTFFTILNITFGAGGGGWGTITCTA